MSPVARHYWGLTLKCSSILAFIGGFVAFMMMMETSGEIEKYRTQGSVSRALVLDLDREVERRSTSGGGRRRVGTTRDVEFNFVRVRFVANSPVSYADVANGVAKESDLPMAPAATGNPVEDARHEGLMDVSHDQFDALTTEAVIPVVTVPWDSTTPRPLSEIREYSPTPYYPWMVIGLLLGIGLWAWAWKLCRAGR